MTGYRPRPIINSLYSTRCPH